MTKIRVLFGLAAIAIALRPLSRIHRTSRRTSGRVFENHQHPCPGFMAGVSRIWCHRLWLSVVACPKASTLGPACSRLGRDWGLIHLDLDPHRHDLGECGVGGCPGTGAIPG